MKRHILFLCTGNLCRSPIAEGILRKKLKQRKIDSVAVSSAGTHALMGEPPAALALKVTAERGVDISEHISRQLTREMLEGADLVIGMERHHLTEAEAILDDGSGKYHLLSEFGPSPGRGSDIEDPYGRPPDYFSSTYDRIERCAEGLLDYILHTQDSGSPKDR